MKKLIVLFLIVAALLAVVYVVMQQDFDAAAPLSTSDFALEDTAAVGKVVITNANGNMVQVARGNESVWMVNDKFRAREDAINVILKTLHLLEIKHPVGAKSREDIIRMMAGRHHYVQVYNRDGDFIKAYYIGIMTPDYRGTYMVLEQPGKGRTEIPYVMTMKSFYGHLTSRFFTDEKDWRDRTLLRYADLNRIDRVEVVNNLHPDRSFAVDYHGGSDFSMTELETGNNIAQFDTSRVKDYLLLYKKVSCETYDLAFEQHQIDSILALPPSFEIKVEAKEPASDKHLRLFLRPAPERQMTDDGEEPSPYDNVIMYGTLDGEELFRVQRYVIDKFLVPKQAFTGELEF